MLAAWSDSTIGDAAMPITFTSESPNHATVETLRGLAAFMDNVSFANCIDQRVQDEIEVIYHSSTKLTRHALMKPSRLN